MVALWVREVQEAAPHRLLSGLAPSCQIQSLVSECVPREKPEREN